VLFSARKKGKIWVRKVPAEVVGRYLEIVFLFEINCIYTLSVDQNVVDEIGVEKILRVLVPLTQVIMYPSSSPIFHNSTC
jgi:hypothetical protein